MPLPSPFVSRTEFNLLASRVGALEATAAAQAALLITVQEQLAEQSAKLQLLALHFVHQ